MADLLKAREQMTQERETFSLQVAEMEKAVEEAEAILQWKIKQCLCWSIKFLYDANEYLYPLLYYSRCVKLGKPNTDKLKLKDMLLYVVNKYKWGKIPAIEALHYISA